MRPNFERQKTPWTFEISCFKDYKFDTDEILNNCFEFDWAGIKLPKMSE